jgi:hypothetical protein
MSKPWPPPPDLASIQDLVRAADPEGHLADGAPTDEYEPEEELIFDAIRSFATANLIAANLIPIIQPIWQKSFALSDTDLASRRPAIQTLAEQIERFFGPEAKPQVRG